MRQSDQDTVDRMRSDIDRVVVSRDCIAQRVEELASEIARCYEAMELTILAVLTGSLVFLADLVRSMPMLMRLDVVSVSSYPGGSTRPGKLEMRLPPQADLHGCNVLILDDILDSGKTLSALHETVQQMNPASVRSCVLLRKNRPDVPERFEADFVGFDVEDEFVVGYGLDYDNLYRNLPDICVLRAAAMTADSGGTGK